MSSISKKFGVVTLSATGLLAGNVSAMEGSVGLQFADFDQLNSGAGIFGHLDVMPQVRLRGEFTSVEFLDLVGWSGAYVISMDAMEMEFGALYEFWDFDGAFEDDVYGAYGRLNYSVMNDLDMFGQLRFLSFKNLEDEDMVMGLGAGYAITDQFSANFGIDIFTNDDMYGPDGAPMFIRLGGSYRF